ncbi:MAG TPA: calmodulin [Chromatiaceae bacterium]|nr:calmodulin [Chromatiaceae bacterium]
MSKKIIVVVLGAFFTVAATAGDVFTTLDADMNGAISKDEASAMPSLSEQWKELDADASGDLSAEEFAGYEKSAEEATMKDAPKASSAK